MLDLSSANGLRDPYPAYARLRASRPVLRDPRNGAWMILDHATVKRVLTDHDAFSSRVALGGYPGRWLIFSDPPRHTQLRALVGRAFTPRSVGDLAPRIETIAQDLLDRTRGRTSGDGIVDVVADFSVPLPMMVIAEMLGAPAEDWRILRGWSDAILGLVGTLSGGLEADTAVQRFGAMVDEMAPYLAALLAKRRAAPTDDLLTRLATAEIDGERLSDDDILAFFQLLLLAGHETTTNLISNALVCFIENEAATARLRANPSLLPAAIEEVLRYRSPVQAMFRATNRDVDLGHAVVPGGSLVLAMIGSANRDPAVFADAERFDLDRASNPHVAFGSGIHACVGAPLARLEAKIALTAILARWRAFDFAEDRAWEPRKAWNVHGPARLPLRIE
jgi:cytochrome P450